MGWACYGTWVPLLWFFPDPEAALAQLERDRSKVRMHLAVTRVLDQLEADSTHESVRRIRFHDPPVWCVKVTAAGEEWVVLWQPHPTEADSAVVRYIGPASFA